jgi:hypothetical protein
MVARNDAELNQAAASSFERIHPQRKRKGSLRRGSLAFVVNL